MQFLLKLIYDRRRNINFGMYFAGSLGTSVFDTDVYLVGASGGVYALLAAHLANVLLVSIPNLWYFYDNNNNKNSNVSEDVHK